MNAAPDLTMTAIKMVLALIVVLAFVISLYYLAKRFVKNPVSNDKEDIIRIWSNKYLGMKKNLYLVEVPGSFLVLGVTNDHISCLSKIEDKEVIKNIKSEVNIKHQTFAGHLQRISSKVFPDKISKTN